MMEKWGSFCSYCGKALTGSFPRTCVDGHITYLNSLIVAVALQPIKQQSKTYLLVVQRGIKPHVGSYALPGGFAENNETVRQAAARELKEEAAIEHHPDVIKDTFYQAIGSFYSSEQDPRGVLLQFEVMPEKASAEIDFNFTTIETRKVGLVSYCEKDDSLKDEDNHPVSLCFPLHDAVARNYLKHVKSVELV